MSALPDLINPLLGIDNRIVAPLCVSVFFAITFLQSGLDKALDYSGNKAYFQDHFKNSPLAKFVPLLLPTITILEIGAGIFCALGSLLWLFNDIKQMALIGISLSAISLLCLFFGQRVAKDYAGASGLVPYFLLAIVALHLFN